MAECVRKCVILPLSQVFEKAAKDPHDVRPGGTIRGKMGERHLRSYFQYHCDCWH